MIYFVRCPANGRIKIGFTSHHPDLRLATLRSGSPVDLEPVAVRRGDRRDEARLHVLFDEYRLHGEWFEPGEKLLAYIARRGKPWPARPPGLVVATLTPEQVQEDREYRCKEFWRDAVEVLSTDLLLDTRARAQAKLEGRVSKFEPILPPSRYRPASER